MTTTWKKVPVQPTDEMRDAGNVHVLSRGTLFAAWRDMLSVAPDAPPESVPAELIQDLVGIAVGRIVHIYNGSCPDQIEGENVRDDECPACQILMRVATEVAAPAQG